MYGLRSTLQATVRSPQSAVCSLQMSDTPEAQLLVEDGGYDPTAKENALRDTLVFGVASDKVRKDAIALGNSLTFKQVHDLAKVDESTKAQMKIISKSDEKSDLHTVQREPAKNFKHRTPYGDQNPRFNWKKTSSTSVQVKRMLQVRKRPR